MYDYPFAVTYHTFAFISKCFQEKHVMSLSMCEHKLNNNIYPFVDLVQSICEFLREFFFFNILVYLKFQVL